MQLLPGLILPVVFLSVLAPASAQVVVTTASTAPTDNLLVSFATDATAGIGWRADSRSEITSENWRDVGQLFVSPSDAVLDKITVVTSSGVNAPARGAAFTLTLYSFGTGFSVANPEIIHTLTGTTPPGAIAGGTFLTFDLPDVQLTAGVTYGFLLHFDSMADNRSIPLRLNNSSNAFAGGRLLTRVNAGDGIPGALGTSTSSLEFYVQTAAIPEPGSVVLFAGVGALAFLFWSRRPAGLRR